MLPDQSGTHQSLPYFSQYPSGLLQFCGWFSLLLNYAYSHNLLYVMFLKYVCAGMNAGWCYINNHCCAIICNIPL
ncbi:hypothetical protein XELAEV_18018595mg [Xenopus laevis]|uniref:Uncharacterized protein n=1 Tax=Xenopus laevis TaxID=8355 RepID=A0A974DEI4_XENLA|nr:hypothetical protein XELAEV_18018595mg [Xenopus laevis]